MTRQRWIDVAVEAGISAAIVFSFLTGSRSEDSYLAGVVLWIGLMLGYALGRVATAKP